VQSWRFGKAKKYPSNTDTGFNYYPHGKRFCFPEDAQATAHIRAILKTKGTPITPIGPYDVMLAGCAKQRNLIFVTDIGVTQLAQNWHRKGNESETM
jgi:hypothetical protein